MSINENFLMADHQLAAYIDRTDDSKPTLELFVPIMLCQNRQLLSLPIRVKM